MKTTCETTFKECLSTSPKEQSIVHYETDIVYDTNSNQHDNGEIEYNVYANETNCKYKMEWITSQSKAPISSENTPLIDFLTYLPNDILTKVDRASMLNGLEVRSPWLSRQIIDFAFEKISVQLRHIYARKGKSWCCHLCFSCVAFRVFPVKEEYLTSNYVVLRIGKR